MGAWSSCWAVARDGGLLPAGPYALLLLPLRSRAHFQRHRVEGTTPGWPTIRPAVFNGYPRISGPSWPRDRSARHSRRLFPAAARSLPPLTSRCAHQASGPRTFSYFTVRTVRTVRNRPAQPPGPGRPGKIPGPKRAPGPAPARPWAPRDAADGADAKGQGFSRSQKHHAGLGERAIPP